MRVLDGARQVAGILPMGLYAMADSCQFVVVGLRNTNQMSSIVGHWAAGGWAAGFLTAFGRTGGLRIAHGGMQLLLLLRLQLRLSWSLDGLFLRLKRC